MRLRRYIYFWPRVTCPLRVNQRSCLLITLHYIDQISVRMPVFVLSSLTCHRFVITSICVSSKCLCDAFHSNSVYAKVGGIPVTELNVLEREFLRMINWNLTVSPPHDHFLYCRLNPALDNMTSRLNIRLPFLRCLNPNLVAMPRSRTFLPPHTPRFHIQCTREVLQEYYVNLVRTYSKGGFVIGDASSSSISSDSDMDYETSPQASPVPAPQPPLQILQAQRPNGGGPSAGSSSSGRREPSTILVDPATLAPESPNPPTVEQNMAFAALQQQQQLEEEAQQSEPEMDLS